MKKKEMRLFLFAIVLDFYVVGRFHSATAEMSGAKRVRCVSSSSSTSSLSQRVALPTAVTIVRLPTAVVSIIFSCLNYPAHVSLATCSAYLKDVAKLGTSVCPTIRVVCFDSNIEDEPLPDIKAPLRILAPHIRPLHLTLVRVHADLFRYADLGAHTQLRTLCLPGFIRSCRHSDSRMCNLLQPLTNLTHLEFGECYSPIDADSSLDASKRLFRVLARLPMLAKLVCPAMTMRAARQLSFTALTSLEIGAPYRVPSSHDLSGFSSLTHLGLKWDNNSINEVRVITRVLTALPNLVSFRPGRGYSLKEPEMLAALLDSPRSASLTKLHLEDAKLDSRSIYNIAVRATQLTTLSFRMHGWPFLDRRNDCMEDTVHEDCERPMPPTMLPSLRDLHHLSGSLTDLDIWCYNPPPYRPDLRPLRIGFPIIPNLRRLRFIYHPLPIRHVRDGTLHSRYPVLETLHIHRSDPEIGGWIDVIPKENTDDMHNTSPGAYYTELGWNLSNSKKITLAALAPIVKLAAILFPSTVTYECRRRSIALIS
jgi:hypothetical protein